MHLKSRPRRPDYDPRRSGAGVRRAIAALLIAGMAGCKPQPEATASTPVPLVETTVVRPRDVEIEYTYGGRITAYRQVEIRARVGGILESRTYVEGARVRAGEVLFRIDPAPYQAAVARAAAQVQQQTSDRGKAERDLRRAETLLASPAGSVRVRDDAASALALADAQLAAAKADLRTQALNLSYTTIAAPLDGVTGLEAAPEGSLVGTATDNSLLTRITQTDPIYVSFSFDSEDLDQIRALAGREPTLTARVTVVGGTRAGRVNFTDSSVSQATGTVRGRALFANADGALAPGQFVRITLGGVVMPGAIVVPKAAVNQDETGAFVYVAEQGRARRTDVTLGPEVADGWVVTGPRPGDAVVTEGLTGIRENAKIRVAGNA